MFDLGPCDLELTVSGIENSSAQIALWDVVVNSTPFPWHDFHHQIGVGTGAGFVLSDELDALFFIDDPIPDGEDFTLIGVDEPGHPDVLDWKVTGDDFPISPPFVPPTTNNFKLLVQVPDADGDGSTTFTVRQIATVDEPPGAMLLIAGLIALARLYRRSPRKADEHRA
jgi:hypothetical protein